MKASRIRQGLLICALGGALVLAVRDAPTQAQTDTAAEFRQCLQATQARLQEGIQLLTRPMPAVSSALPKLYDTLGGISDCMARFIPAQS